MKKVHLIVAASENNVIGIQNNLPWHLPNDMIFFKKTTLNSSVIMGRKNYLSIPHKFRPLKDRVNIILTSNTSFKAEGCLIANSLEDGISMAQKEGKEIFIIGGGKVYAYSIQNNLVDVMYITRIHANIKGDTFFPKLNMQDWEKKSEIFHPKDANHKYDFTYLKYIKID
tara:strand:- start:86 stop:595 length:510 start_codon:yes stop_codon:yes gene_type:complete